MKLIDILVQELPKRGGWPGDIHVVVQNSSGCIYKAGGGPNIYHFALADDWMEAEIKREQYETALAASKTEWDGAGLPPVGCDCEFQAVDGSWGVGTVLCVGKMRVFWLCHEDGMEYNAEIEPREFRPIRSEADKKRDEAIKAMASAPKPCGHPIVGVCSEIYDAIAAGKIPGIRID